MVLEACREGVKLVDRVESRDRNLADQLRRAMQSVGLQFAEGCAAVGGNRRAKLLGARAEANEVLMGLELAVIFGHLEASDVAGATVRFERVARTLYAIGRR